MLPTYLKNLSNIQIKLVWQNAAIELSEATRIVFIGYSLPAADFEIRQLLARMIRPDAEIQVVLYPNTPNVEAEAERYRNFFGSRISERDIMRLTVPEYVKEKTKKLRRAGDWEILVTFIFYFLTFILKVVFILYYGRSEYFIFVHIKKCTIQGKNL